ncbi:GTP cyclohydrolase I FolE [Alphaproteobacteria bacterium]|nr:GTP cyclohydrolase I FolE [Alphaproteobacteria bacterium]
MSSFSSVTKAFKGNDTKKEVTIEEAEKAVETLLTWIGDDPKREGLVETPKRVIKAFREHFSGYRENPSEILSKTFKEIQGYDDIVVLKKIDFESHCEHHMLPIIGNASIGYLPNKSIVGISKLARIVNTFAKRLQTQEIMTSQIVNAINDNLNPIGVGVVIEADHHCMKTRGVHKKNSLMITSQFKGSFLTDEKLRNRFLDFIKD